MSACYRTRCFSAVFSAGGYTRSHPRVTNHGPNSGGDAAADHRRMRQRQILANPSVPSRREFVMLLGGAAAAGPLAAQAQSTTVARVGFLRQEGPDDKQFEAFRGGLHAAGYIEGQNLVIEQRYAAGAYDRLRGLAMELVRSNVDVIVVDGTAAAKACKEATATTPVIFTLAVDPVADMQVGCGMDNFAS
jgi:hypothetical protein